MKDGYRYSDGKVIVTDYDRDKIRNEEKRDYQDNIDELLITENVVEYLDDLEDNFVSLVEDMGNKIDVNYLSLIGNVVGMIFSFIVLMIFLDLVVNNLVISTIASILLSGGYFSHKKIIPILKNIKANKRIKQGLDFALEGLEDEIINNEAKLVLLEIDDKRDKEEEIKNNNGYRQVNYIDRLEEVNEYLDLHYSVFKSEDEYLKYLEQGACNNELDEMFDQEERIVLKKVLTNRKNK